MSGRDLDVRCRALEGRGYPAYRSLVGAWKLGGGLTLFVDRVASDPFAPPSLLRLRVDPETARVPERLRNNRIRRVALADWLARQVERATRIRKPRRTGSGASGTILVDAGGQTVLERSAVGFPEEGGVEARLEVGLPANGRRISGRAAASLLTRDLPAIARRALAFPELDATAAGRFVDEVAIQEDLRRQLAEHRLAAFVANGALLPRAHGASDRPLPADGAVRFESPPRLAVELTLPGGGTIPGMGIPEGITVIVGGGFHGKSTLLQALAHGVSPHIPGDGRERVVTRADAVAVRAEEGRPILDVDLSPLIGDLPGGRRTERFRTADASGSTSQAASLVEALEAGARLLLLDEDTSATNLLLRDARMQALVARRSEPITPLLDRIRALRDDRGVSAVLVMGGSGDYLDVADTVIRMDGYRARDVTAEARRVARTFPLRRTPEPPAPWAPGRSRVPRASSFDPAGRRGRPRIRTTRRDELLYGEDAVDLRAVGQIFEASQTRAIGHALALAATRFMDRPVPGVLDAIETHLDREGIDGLTSAGRNGEHPGRLARPRRYEVAAAMNRLRRGEFRQDSPEEKP